MKTSDTTGPRSFSCPKCGYRSQAGQDPAAEMKTMIANIAHMVSHLKQDSKGNPRQSTGTQRPNSSTEEAPGSA